MTCPALGHPAPPYHPQTHYDTRYQIYLKPHLVIL